MKRIAFFILLCLLVIICESDAKRTKQRWRERNLQEQCKRNRNSRLESAPSPITEPLQLQAFLDLNKGIVCFKVESCNRPAVCIVEENSELKQRQLNDCTLWNQFTTILSEAPTRKIEPVIIGENSKCTKRRSSWYQPRRQWPDAIYSMCRCTIVYRFLANPQNSTNNTAEQPSNGNPPVPTTALPTVNNREPSVAKSKRNLRAGRRRSNRPKKFRLPSCVGHGMNIPCTRICVGQDRAHRNSSSCSAFKIKCTFHRRSEGSVQGNSKSRNRGSRKKSGRKPARD